MRNPIPELLEQSNVRTIIECRIAQFNDIFGFEKDRIRDWCFVQTVLSACWAEEDKSRHLGYFIACAELFDLLQ